jgi:hypothetical protein
VYWNGQVWPRILEAAILLLLMDFRRPAIAVSLLLVMAGLGMLWLRARQSAGMDFYQVWVGARMARETESFYSPATGARMGDYYFREAVAQGRSQRQIAVAQYRRNLELVGTPLLFSAYSILPRDYERALLIFQLAALACLAGWIAILARIFAYDTLQALVIAGFLFVIAEPTGSDIAVGNLNQLMALLVAAAAFATVRHRFAAAGAILAVATLLKPYVILTIPFVYLFWIVRRRWKDIAAHLAGAAIASVAAIVASIVYFGSWTIWTEWLIAFRTMNPAIISIDIGNMALAALSRPASIVLFAAGIAATIFAAFRRPSDDVLPILLGCAVFQLVSPLVWLHYLVLVMPLVFWLLRPASPRHAQIAGAVSLALIAVKPWDALVPTVEWVAVGVNVGLAITIASVILSREDGEGSPAGRRSFALSDAQDETATPSEAR